MIAYNPEKGARTDGKPQGVTDYHGQAEKPKIGKNGRQTGKPETIKAGKP